MWIRKLSNATFLLTTLAGVAYLFGTAVSIDTLSNNPGIDPGKLHAAQAKTLIEEGNAKVPLKEKIDNYCGALKEIAESLRYRPYSSRYLLTWANIKQLLGTWACAQESPGDVLSVLELALKMSPTDASVNYAAGLIYLWSGDKLNARRLFAKVVQYDPNATLGKELVMRGAIENVSDIAEIVPARFPHVIRWLGLLSDYPPLHATEGVHLEAIKALGALQIRALNSNREEYEAGIIDKDIFETRLFELSSLAEDPEARSVVDNEMSRLVFNELSSNEHQLFQTISGLERMPVVLGLLSHDRRPLKSPLLTWGYAGEVNVLAENASTGFYRAEGWETHAVIFIGAKDDSRVLEKSGVKVLVSEDNQSWAELNEEVDWLEGTMLSRPWFSVLFKKPLHARYVKFRVEIGVPNARFQEPLSTLIRVYGKRAS